MFIVFDLDGTLSLNEHRNHFVRRKKPDWDSYLAACGDDGYNLPIIAIMRALNEAYCPISGYRLNTIEVWSGRSASTLDTTHRWWRAGDLPLIDNMRLRPVGDYRPDTELKAAWMDEFGKPDFVFDDRATVIKMFRDHGVTALQVAKGDF